MTSNQRLVLLLALIAPAIALGAQTSPPPAAPMAITDVTVIDSTGTAAQPHMTVALANGRIADIAPSERFRALAGADIIEGTGKFLIPGLWDMHVHLGSYEDGKKELPHLLAYGITGVRDMASPVEDIVRLRHETSVGIIAGPRMIVAGPILQGPLPFSVPPLVRTITDANDAKNTVDELKAKGVDFIKIGDTLPRDLYLAIAGESKRLLAEGHGNGRGHDACGSQDSRRYGYAGWRRSAGSAGRVSSIGAGWTLAHASSSSRHA